MGEFPGWLCSSLESNALKLLYPSRTEAAVEQSADAPPDVGVAMETSENEDAVGAASHRGQDDLVLGAEGWSLLSSRVNSCLVPVRKILSSAVLWASELSECPTPTVEMSCGRINAQTLKPGWLRPK